MNSLIPINLNEDGKRRTSQQRIDGSKQKPYPDDRLTRNHIDKSH